MQQHKDTEATELYVDKRTLERYKTEETNDKDQVALCCMLAVVTEGSWLPGSPGISSKLLSLSQSISPATPLSFTLR